MNYVSAVVFALTLASTPAAFAATPMEGMDMKPAGQTKQAPKPVAAEVRKIYLDTGKVTLKHGAIDNLGMGAMTMTFAVKDKASLQHFKEGQRCGPSLIWSTVSRPSSICGASKPSAAHGPSVVRRCMLRNQPESPFTRAPCRDINAERNNPAIATLLAPSIQPATTSAGKCIPAATRDHPNNAA